MHEMQSTRNYSSHFCRYYTSFVSLMAHKYKEVFAASAEVLGMVLAYMDEKKDVS